MTLIDDESAAITHIRGLITVGALQYQGTSVIIKAQKKNKYETLHELKRFKEEIENTINDLKDKDGLLAEIERKYNLGIPSKISNILRVLDNTSPAGVKQNIEYALQLLNAENYERVIELCETINKSLDSISSDSDFIRSIPYRIDTKWLAEIYKSKKQSALEFKISRLEYKPEVKSKVKNKKIFIVHGRDNSSKLALKDLLRDWGLEPIILHEKPSKGLTIIEKVEHYSDVDYAIVILTPDDKGRSKTSNKLNPRARQNVVFELGFFYGKLRRDSVTCLYKKGVERPSDIEGIVYIPFDKDLKKEVYEDLRKELREAGFTLKD